MVLVIVNYYLVHGFIFYVIIYLFFDMMLLVVA